MTGESVDRTYFRRYALTILGLFVALGAFAALLVVVVLLVRWSFAVRDAHMSAQREAKARQIANLDRLVNDFEHNLKSGEEELRQMHEQVVKFEAEILSSDLPPGDRSLIEDYEKLRLLKIRNERRRALIDQKLERLEALRRKLADLQGNPASPHR